MKERVRIVTRGNHSIVVKDNIKNYQQRLRWHNTIESITKLGDAARRFGTSLGNQLNNN